MVLYLIRVLSEIDELGRRMAFESLGIAFVWSFVGAFAYGALAAYKIVPHASALVLAMGMIVIWSVSFLVVRRRY